MDNAKDNLLAAVPDEFVRLQTSMTTSLYCRLQTRGVDVDEYYLRRHACYHHRWKEALIYLDQPSKILDVGAGFQIQTLLERILAPGHQYFSCDIDARTVEATRPLAIKLGIDPTNIRIAPNNALPWPADDFDIVFSSHCLEHSFDLSATFLEISRVLRLNGLLAFAVPIGWDPANEHPYFLDADDWIALVEKFGFDILNVHIGKTYADWGYDLFVVARLVNRPSAPIELDQAQFSKSSWRLVDRHDPACRFDGPWHETSQGHWIGNSLHSAFSWAGFGSEMMIFCGHHPWSGIIEVSVNGVYYNYNLYSWYTYHHPVLAMPYRSGPAPLAIDLEVHVRGKDPRSASCEFVFDGLLIR